MSTPESWVDAATLRDAITHDTDRSGYAVQNQLAENSAVIAEASVQAVLRLDRIIELLEAGAPQAGLVIPFGTQP